MPESQPPSANPATIAAIIDDAHDEPLRNKATRVAVEILKQVPDLPGKRNDIMMTAVARHGGRDYVVCSNTRATVLFMGKHAFVLAQDGGGLVPWVDAANMYAPDMSFFKGRVQVEDQLADRLLQYVETLMRAEHAAVAAALDSPDDEEHQAPAP
ncbi:hypothetical protein [Massilia sp. X63]|uniref:hypothetical protein n=1 Tax=Massilia sp. X63 TaxID=3237285 RepID=UPI0034DD30E8